MQPQARKRKQPEAATATAAVAARLPTVVCLRRSRGAVVQDCDVYIGRGWTKGGWDLPRSKWANPYTLRDLPRGGSVKHILEKYRDFISQQPALLAALPELYGKRLGCWCKRRPSDLCHGDVLVDLCRREMKLAEE